MAGDDLTVQELAMKGKDLPARYVFKDGHDEGAAMDAASLPLVDIPIVDLSKLSSSSFAREEELGTLRSALSTWGCFQAINHGIEGAFLDDLHQVTKQFFALPMEEKKKYLRKDDDLDGYGNDTVLSEHQTLDWSDRLYLTVYPPEIRKLHFWPKSPPKFREILDDYTLNLHRINENLLKHMAKSLNLEESCFLNQYGDGATVTARFNFYPKCPRPDLALGVKPHADGSAITILLQDKEVQGLQVQRDDQWFRVSVVPHALLVNAGDQLEIMSNGVFKSPIHRVSTNSEKDRISVAMFFLPEREKEIAPADGLVDEDRPRLYKTIKNFVDFYFENYQEGKRAIEVAKL